jgi:putative multiple sugar transport system permease protein
VASLIQQNAYVMILAIGMVIVIIAGHIDLSVGSLVALIGGATAILMKDHGVPWYWAVLAGILLGALAGAWQGFWVAYVGIPAFIVTLGGMLIFRGLAIVIVGVTIASFPDGFNAISNDSVVNSLGYVAGDRDVMTLVFAGITIAALLFSQLRARITLHKHDLQVEPFVGFLTRNVLFAALIGAFGWIIAGSRGGTPIVLLIVGVLVVVYAFVTNRTVFGRDVYAMGGNLQAAILSGVNTKKVNFWIFVNIGMLTGIAGIVTTSKAGAAVANAGNMYELDAIASCFIGGTAVTGGIGRVSGVIVGALVIGVLNMGLSIMRVDPAWQQVIKGLVLLFAVAFDLVNKRRAGAR